MIAPNRRNRCKTQDGRQLRRYKRRWKVERFFSWLQSYRHITVRYDYYAGNYFNDPAESLYYDLSEFDFEIISNPDFFYVRWT